jgi:hypothetical protein
MELSSHPIDPETLRTKAKEAFISRRTIEEQKINNWYHQLLKLDKELVLDKIPFDYSDMSLQTLVPELYKEFPNAEVVRQQREEANKKLETINEIYRQNNAEGLRLLEEYNALQAGGR